MHERLRALVCLVRALELAEQGVQLGPVLWCDGEAAMLARDDVL